MFFSMNCETFHTILTLFLKSTKQTKEIIYSMECKTSWRILILFSKSAKEITNSLADYHTNEMICSMNCKTLQRIWTLTISIKSVKEIKHRSVNYQTKEIIICSIDWKTFYRILTVYFFYQKSAKETENSLAVKQTKWIIC